MPKEKKKMKNLSIYMPWDWVDLMDKVVETGLYNSRSEIIRSHMRAWMEAELEFSNTIKLVNKIIDEFTKSTKTTLHLRKELIEKSKEVYKEIIESEKLFTDCDGNNWNIKELANSPKLTHKKGINEV